MTASKRMAAGFRLPWKLPLARPGNGVLLATLTAMKLPLRLASTMILTRLLAPEAFALVGIASTVIYIMEMLTDTGTRSFILKQAGGDREHYLNTLWTLSVIRAGGLCLATIMLAKPVAAWLSLADLEYALYIASFSFLILGTKSLAPFVAERQNRPRRVITAEFAAFAISSVAVIITTLIFRSHWCIIIGLLYQPALTNFFSYRLFDRRAHRFEFDAQVFRQCMSWARYVLPSSLITIAATQFDKFVIAKAFSAEFLAFYYLAFTLAQQPLQFIQSFSVRLVGPAVAEGIHTRQADIVERYYAARQTMWFLMMVVLGAGIALSQVAIDILYDPRYQVVGSLLQVMLLGPVFALFSMPTQEYLVAHGQAWVALVANLLRFAWVLLLLYPAYYYFQAVGVVAVFATSEAAAASYLQWRAYIQGKIQVRTELAFLLAGVTAFVLASLFMGLLGL